MESMHKELLKNFKELFDDGLITAEEYQAKKAEVLAMVSQSARLSEAASARPSMQMNQSNRPSVSQGVRPSGSQAGGASGPAVSQYGSVSPRNQARPSGQSSNLSIDQILNELGNVSLEPPSARPSVVSRSARPSVSAAGSGTTDLDQFVEMLAGSRDTRRQQEIAQQANTPSARPSMRETKGNVVGGAGAAAAAGSRPAAAAAATSTVPYDEARFINCEHTIQGHTGYVFALEFHNNRLFSASADKTIMVWDLASMKCTKVLRSHTHAVYALCVDEPGNRLFSAGWDLVIRVWNLTTLEEMRELKGHTAYVSCLKIFGDKLYSGAWDGSVRVWSLQTLKNIDTMSIEHTGTIWDIQEIDNIIYTASQDKSIKNWSGKTFNYKDTLGEIGSQQHKDWVLSIVPVGSRLFSCSRDKTIFEWDLTERHIKCISVIEGHGQPVTTMTRKGNYLISGDSKGFVKIWHIETHDLVDTIPAHKDWIYVIKVVGNYLFTCSRDRTIKIWV